MLTKLSESLDTSQCIENPITTVATIIIIIQNARTTSIHRVELFPSVLMTAQNANTAAVDQPAVARYPFNCDNSSDFLFRTNALEAAAVVLPPLQAVLEVHAPDLDQPIADQKAKKLDHTPHLKLLLWIKLKNLKVHLLGLNLSSLTPLVRTKTLH